MQLIEVLYATNTRSGYETDLLAHPFCKTPEWWNVHHALQEKLSIDCLCNKDYDGLIDKLCTGEECEYGDYTFGWKTIGFQD